MENVFEMVKKEMGKRMPEYKFEVQIVKKANVTYTGIAAILDKNSASPVFSIPDDITINEIEKFCDGVEYQIAHMKMPINDYMSVLTDWENAKDKLFIRVVNVENSKPMLDETPHKIVGDIAIVPYVEINDNATTAANFKLCTLWGISPDSILEIAINNAKSFKPVCCFTTYGALLSIISNGDITQSPVEGESAYVISNKELICGASTIFYDGVLDFIGSELFNSDFWILPSSINEVLVIKAEDDNAIPFYHMVKTINETEVSSSEILSNRPFYYDKNKKNLYQYNPDLHGIFPV